MATHDASIAEFVSPVEVQGDPCRNHTGRLRVTNTPVSHSCYIPNQGARETLTASLTQTQARLLKSLLEVAEGARRLILNAWKRAPTTPTGIATATALDRIAAIAALNMTELDVEVVPHRWLVNCPARMSAKGPTIKPHRYDGMVATVLQRCAG